MSTDELSKAVFNTEFAGWGSTLIIEDLDVLSRSSPEKETQHFKLGEWASTALCGNDITSSCLYVSGLSIIHGGILAPVVLLLVSLTLFLYRKIYSEVGEALPLNGGTYTLLLNTTSKKTAAAAACLTLLSYVATGVISATEAIHYIRVLVHEIPLAVGVVSLLGFFTLLSILGVKESSRVALVIFFTHLVTLAVLIVSGVIKMGIHPEVLISNITSGWADLHPFKSLFFGFSVALLGISGFESSANFIEEQKPGVFPKTLRNMWIAVTVLNPAITVVALAIVPLAQVPEIGEGFLSHIGAVSVGPWFAKWIAIDAFLVLSGAVLTSYVGVLGLIRRMALDRCFPRFLLSENKLRKTNHWIILAFFVVCLSIFFLTHGVTEDLAGVYTLSFLSVMAFFAIGNALLKVKRARLPRVERAPWEYIVFGLIFIAVGIVGNTALNPGGAGIFLAYYAATLLLVFSLLLRAPILRFLLSAVQYSVRLLPTTKNRITQTLSKWLKQVNSVPIIYFTKGDNLAGLNQAVFYVVENEQTHSMTVCHVYNKKADIPDTLIEQVKIIDQLYPRLKVDLLLIKGVFGPPIVDAISNRFNIVKNRMFIGSPGGAFPHRLEHLGGVRVILAGDSI